MDHSSGDRSSSQNWWAAGSIHAPSDSLCLLQRLILLLCFYIEVKSFYFYVAINILRLSLLIKIFVCQLPQWLVLAAYIFQ